MLLRLDEGSKVLLTSRYGSHDRAFLSQCACDQLDIQDRKEGIETSGEFTVMSVEISTAESMNGEYLFKMKRRVLRDRGFDQT